MKEQTLPRQPARRLHGTSAVPRDMLMGQLSCGILRRLLCPAAPPSTQRPKNDRLALAREQARMELAALQEEMALHIHTGEARCLFRAYAVLSMMSRCSRKPGRRLPAA